MYSFLLITLVIFNSFKILNALKTLGIFANLNQSYEESCVENISYNSKKGKPAIMSGNNAVLM